MRNLDLVQEHTVALALAPASIASATNGASIDLQQFNGGGFQFNVGAGGNVTFKLQDSADNSTFADVTAPMTINGVLPSVVVNASNVGVLRLDPSNTRRYVRIVATPSAAVIASATALLHKANG